MAISTRLVYPRTHRFHIPVMGTGHSIDTPLRVARWGISSVVSLVDDVLCEQVQKLWADRLGHPFQGVDPRDPKARALRFRNYLDFLDGEVSRQMEELRSQEFEAGSDKYTWFEMLPDSSPLKTRWKGFLSLPAGEARDAEGAALTQAMEPGAIDVNIMTKLDRRPTLKDGTLVEARLSDAKLALEGFATSKVRGSMVFSAGINPTLYGTLEEFSGFYRQGGEEAEKGIIIKVSDFRSAMTQGRFLAKKGIEVREFRIESGLNCGGHAFASDGELLGPILDEFRRERPRLREEFAKSVRAYYQKKGMDWNEAAEQHEAAITVQGGLGNYAENRRMLEEFGMDSVGWGSPFLLVPEATPIDDTTRAMLAASRREDLYLSPASPLGVPFNNLRGSTAEQELRRRFDEGKAGSACPKGFLVSNTEFTEKPICTASREYLAHKIDELGGYATVASRKVAVKECICHQLGNGALEYIKQETAKLRGESTEVRRLPVSICPGPNIAWFDRYYSLREMVDHIYGRSASLVPAHRPHCFAAEIEMYLDHFDTLKADTHPENPKQIESLERFKANLAASLAWYREWLAGRSALEGENLANLIDTVEEAELRLFPAEEGAILGVR
ncbi:MAG: hypothetical protein H6686_02060 [Fibrobacteria bacterium]|nr:hypothetical protein [Fibrobacteria bacterium]